MRCSNSRWTANLKSAADEQPISSDPFPQCITTVMSSANSQTDEPFGMLLDHLCEQIQPLLAFQQGTHLQHWCSFQAHCDVRPAFLHPVDSKKHQPARVCFLCASSLVAWQAFCTATVAVGIFSIFGAKAYASPFPEHGKKD